MARRLLVAHGTRHQDYIEYFESRLYRTLQLRILPQVEVEKQLESLYASSNAAKRLSRSKLILLKADPLLEQSTLVPILDHLAWSTLRTLSFTHDTFVTSTSLSAFQDRYDKSLLTLDSFVIPTYFDGHADNILSHLGFPDHLYDTWTFAKLRSSRQIKQIETYNEDAKKRTNPFLLLIRTYAGPLFSS